jgi:hypothetical protein
MAAHKTEDAVSSQSSLGSPNNLEKGDHSSHIEQIHTNERVENPRYYEKDGLRTYGDDEDHDHEPPV